MNRFYWSLEFGVRRKGGYVASPLFKNFPLSDLAWKRERVSQSGVERRTWQTLERRVEVMPRQ